jgi:hypothetical protein
MATEKHPHSETAGDGELTPAKLNVANGALYADGTAVGIGTTTPKSALDVRTSLGSTDPVASVTYAGRDAVDKIALQAVSIPCPDYGTGGSFLGGTIGIIARAESRGGTGERVGGEFWAQQGRATYGIKATTFGSTDPESGVHIAGYFHADHEQNHGEFWAGYFLGRVHISENVGIGTMAPRAKLDVAGNVRIGGDNNSLAIEHPQAPRSSDDSMGEKGQIAWDNEFLYVKTQAGDRHVWKRAKLEEW